MGILEQILEANKNLSEQLSSLSNEVGLMKEKIENYSAGNKLKMEFSENETLNYSMTARVLGIKQHELDEIIEGGLLQSVGEKKKIFLAKDILEFIQHKDEPIQTKQTDKPKRKKAIKKNQITEDVNSDDWAKLVRLNNSN